MINDSTIGSIGERDDQKEEGMIIKELEEPVEPRYQQRICHAPKMYTINIITRLRDEDEPTAREAIKRDEMLKWRLVMHEELDALKQLDCLEGVQRVDSQNVFRRKFVRKENEMS